jgi:hypothetical protein
MTSIFDLKTNESELSSTNQGTSKIQYEEVTSRDVTNGTFANGPINYDFSMSGNKWFIPSRSYINVKMQITKANGTALDLSDKVGMNMGVCSNLFQSAEFRLNNTVISRVANFMPQIDALQTRMNKTDSWLQTMGASTNWWQNSALERINQVSSDGKFVDLQTPVDDVTSTRTAMGFDALAANNNSWAYTAATGALVYARTSATGLTAAQASTAFPVGSYYKYVGVAATPEVEMKVLSNDAAGNLILEPLLNVDVVGAGDNDFARVVKSGIAGSDSRQLSNFQTIWTPPLGIFGIEGSLPVGDYRLTLNPETSSVYKKMAIESLDLDKVAGTDFNFEITEMSLYVCVVDGPRVPDDISFLIDIDNVRCQSEDISSTNFHSRSFSVSPSTFALTAAYQDTRTNADSRLSASKFKSSTVAYQTNEELKLNRFYINYAGQSRPSQDASPSFVPSTGTDHTVQVYVDSMLNSGMYFAEAAPESIETFHERGQFLHYAWSRDGSDNSTRVIVNQSFDNADVTNMRLLLFDHYKSAVRVNVSGGRVTNVEVQDA